MSAERRLMDLLAGWEDYVRDLDHEGEPGKAAYEAEGDAVARLYQKSARLYVPLGERDEEREREAVQKFVLLHVLPLILDGVK